MLNFNPTVCNLKYLILSQTRTPKWIIIKKRHILIKIAYNHISNIYFPFMKKKYIYKLIYIKIYSFFNWKIFCFKKTRYTPYWERSGESIWPVEKKEKLNWPDAEFQFKSMWYSVLEFFFNNKFQGQNFSFKNKK